MLLSECNNQNNNSNCVSIADGVNSLSINDLLQLNISSSSSSSPSSTSSSSSASESILISSTFNAVNPAQYCFHPTNKKNLIDSKKFEDIYSLASILNSRSLEQNSELLLNLVIKSFPAHNDTDENVLLRNQQQQQQRIDNNASEIFFIKILTEMIYAEWRELYDWAQTRNLRRRLATNVDLNNNQTKSGSCSRLLDSSSYAGLFNTNENTLEILANRLKARFNCIEAFNNLTLRSLSPYMAQNEQKAASSTALKRVKILKYMAVLNKFNESVLAQMNSYVRDDQRADVKLDLNTADLEKICGLLDDLIKRSYDEEYANILNGLGVLHAICELNELIWNLIYFLDETNEESSVNVKWTLFNRITLQSLSLIKNLSFFSELAAHRSCFLMALYNCFNKCLYFIRKFNHNNRNVDSLNNQQQQNDLIRMIIYLLTSLFGKKKLKIDSNRLNLEQFNFIDLMLRCFDTFSSDLDNIPNLSVEKVQESQSILKLLINCLQSFCSNSMHAKAKVCQEAGLLRSLIRIVSSEYQIKDDKLAEASISLLRSLSSYFSMNESLRDELRQNGLLKILLNVSLASSNLNIVANACSILWSMTAVRCKLDDEELCRLGAEIKLRGLTNSNNRLISMGSLATLKNLYVVASACSTPTTIINNCLCHQVSNSSSLSSFTASFHSTSPILTFRNRKQALEDSNDFIRKLNEIIPSLSPSCSCESLSSTSTLTFSSSSSSSSMSSSSSTTSITSSSSSSSTDLDDTSSTSSSSSDSSLVTTSKGSYSLKNTYYINDRYDKREEKNALTESSYSDDSLTESNNECCRQIQVFFDEDVTKLNKKPNIKLTVGNSSLAVVAADSPNQQPTTPKHVTFRDDLIQTHTDSLSFGDSSSLELVNKILVDESTDIEIDANDLKLPVDQPQPQQQPIISLDLKFQSAPFFQSTVYTNFLKRSSNRQCSTRCESPTLDTSGRFIKSNSFVERECQKEDASPVNNNSSLISILEPTQQLIEKLDASLSVKSATKATEATKKPSTMTTWSTLSTKLNRSSSTVESSIVNNKKPQKQIGLVRPMIPARTCSLLVKNNANASIPPKPSSVRVQSSRLIKCNNFIIEDQKKKYRPNETIKSAPLVTSKGRRTFPSKL